MNIKNNFKKWFKTNRPAFYGCFATDFTAVKTLGEKCPEFLLENKMVAPPAGQQYLDSRSDKDLIRLATDFNGKPYIHPQEAPYLLKNMTEPTLACHFFDATQPVYPKFANTLLKESDNWADEELKRLQARKILPSP